MGPLKILLLDQVVITIEEFDSRSRKNYAIYDGTTYRNLFPNQIVTIEPLALSSAAGTVSTVTVQDPGSMTGVTIVTDPDNTVQAQRVIVDDSVAKVEPRIWKKVRTRIEFWKGDGGVGTVVQMDIVTVSGNATVTVGSNALLVPGQSIVADGIPADAVIAEIPLDSTTTVILSHKATASATVEATFGGSDYVGGYWEDEELGDGDEINILQ